MKVFGDGWSLIHLRTRWNVAAACFAVLWLFIAVVSVHDGYLVVLNKEHILEAEQNTLGRYLIEQNGGEVWLFLLAKAAGTAIACTVLLLLYRHVRRLALAVAGSMACFQFSLLLYLTLP
jgi:tryptophan-rich sensory protein